ncbi:spermine oxidase-like [Diachasmimorpha longicaudata]|uniref:spermine oxidase-like n=1 Tax=Diachasmimorpha longicaudata TaxID=58733 RepID=UPI0030B8DB2A
MQHEGSYGDLFINRFNDYYEKNRFTDEARASQILEWMGKFDNSIQCSDSWFNVSAKGLAEYKHCDGDLLLNWKNRGYKTLLDILRVLHSMSCNYRNSRFHCLTSKKIAKQTSELIVVKMQTTMFAKRRQNVEIERSCIHVETDNINIHSRESPKLETSKTCRLFHRSKHKHPDHLEVFPIFENIRCSTEVKKIDYVNPNEITITTHTGEDIKANNVIFTASLGVLKHDYTSLFNPPLPRSKELAINGLNIGTVNKIFLEFSHQWWPTEAADFEFLWPEEEKKKFLEETPAEDHWLLDVFGFFTVDYQPRILCGWITGEGARDMETLPACEVKEKIYGLLKKFLDKKYIIPSPDKILTSKWHSDSSFRGSYSFRSLTSEDRNVWASDLAHPIVTGVNKPIILFAGEATHSHYYSTVHGAVMTGFREANRLIEYYARGSAS